MDFRRVTQHTIEHVVVTADRPYHEIQAALEAQMSIVGDTGELVRQFAAAKLSWDQIKHAIEERMGRSGFTILGKVEQGTIACICRQAHTGVSIYGWQSAARGRDDQARAGNCALCPLRIALYEDGNGKTAVARNSFSSLLAQYGGLISGKWRRWSKSKPMG